MRWIWIDRIVEFEANQRLVAIKNVSLAEEHLHDHFAADDELAARPLMPATLLIEGMAQTAGILVGSVHGFREKVILGKITTARFDAEVAPGQTVRYEARLERIDAQGASTRGLVQRNTHTGDGWEPIGRVDLLFSHIDQNLAGITFPEENFVFSETLRMVLRSAGLEGLMAT
ncbi:MAG: beta-hydroxyacyl-ACP dehydratase [Myxococcota bacterium]